MKIKTSDTFFPTKFRPVTANTNQQRELHQNQNSRSYKLVKKRSSTQQSYLGQTNQLHSKNIFKNTHSQFAEFNYQKDRPVGGIDAFLKQHNKKTRAASTRKLSNHTQSPQNRKRQAEQALKPSGFAVQQQEISTQLKPKQQKIEEVFKSHHSYNGQRLPKPQKLTNQNKLSNYASCSSEKNRQRIAWADRQTQQFQTKMSVLNQVYYKKPVVQKYGDRYFQFFMRNRFQDDFAPPVYIHQIRSEMQAKNANKDKFISKIKKLHSNIRNFERLVVKGRHFTINKQSQSYQNV